MDTQRARARLDAERERLTALRATEAGVVDEQLKEADSELSGFDQHPGDQGSETFEREKEASILEHLDAALVDLEYAFHRLEEGTYGLCEVDGKPIPDERLEAVPAARYCVTHQSEVDRRGRA